MKTIAAQDELHDAAVASTTRQRVLSLVAESDDPVDAAEIASQIAIHLTTVRFHLKRLEDAGLVRRQIDKKPRRGRPRVVYRAGPMVRNDTSRSHLLEVLAGALAGEDDDATRSVRAGRRWADQLAETKPDAPEIGTDALLRVLDRVGFDPVFDRVEFDGAGIDGAGVIRLLACPFRVAAAEFPHVVCAVHRGLIERTLEIAGADPSAVRLSPFVEPELCTVTLGIRDGRPTADKGGPDGRLR